MTFDRHGEKRPLPHPVIMKVDGFIRANWRLLLFVAMIALFMIWPFFAPSDVPDFMTMGD